MSVWNNLLSDPDLRAAYQGIGDSASDTLDNINKIKNMKPIISLEVTK